MQFSVTPITIGLLIGFILEFFLALYLLGKDRSFTANKLLSLAYVSLGLTIFTNFVYIQWSVGVETALLFHRISNSFAIIFGIFLFATATWLRFGNDGFRGRSFLILTFFSLISIIGILFSSGVIMHEELLNSNISYVAHWDVFFFTICSFPILLLGSFVVYYFSKLWLELKSDPVVSRQLFLSIIAYFLITLAYFISRLPFLLQDIIPEFAKLLDTLALISSMLVLIVSVIIAYIFTHSRTTTAN